MHFVSEPGTMQEWRGDGTDTKLCNLINQLEELLQLIKEGPKVIRSRSPESDNVPDTRDPMRPNELAKPVQAEAEAPPSGHVLDTMEFERLEAAKPPPPLPPQAEADVPASSEGRNEYDRPGNESENVETTCCEQGSGRPQRVRRPMRSHRAVSKQWRDMTWSWLEPDGAALRLRRFCRQGRVLLAEWRGLCVRACPEAPATPPTWPETASDEACTSSREGVGDCWRKLGEAYAVPSERRPRYRVDEGAEEEGAPPPSTFASLCRTLSVSLLLKSF